MTEKDINNKLNKNIDQLKMINENEIRENNLSNGRHTIAILGIERKNEDKLIRRIVWEQDVFINKLDLSREKIKEIAEKYSPILSFNEKEKYFPMSLEEMFSDLTLEEKKLRIRYHKLRNFAYKLNKKYQIIHFDDLKNILPYNGHRNALLDVYAPESVFLDALSRRKGDINNITVYYSLIEREGKYYLNYHFLYLYDPKGGGIPSVIGIHLFDRESCTIVLNENMYPEKILYGAHLAGQKMWLSENGNEKPKWNGGRVSIEWDRSLRYGEHPVLAIAKGAHAIYPVNGEYSFMVFSETAGGIENIENFLVYPSIFAKKSKNIKGYRIENLLNEDFENGKSVLNFSGYYVDILGKNNAKFPPFTSREVNPAEYARGESVEETELAFEGFKIDNTLPENCVKQFKNLIGSLAVEENSIKYVEDKIKSTEIDLKWESKVGGNINSDLDGYAIYRKSNIEGETEYKNIGIIQKKYNEKDECIGYNIYNKINTNEIYKKINPIGTIGYNNNLFNGSEFGYKENFKEFLYRDLMLIPETEYEYKISGFTKLEEYYVTENGIKDENKNQYVEGIIEDTSIKLVTKKLEKPKSINYGVNEREEFEILIEESKEIEEMKENIKKAGDLIEEEIEIGYILEYSEELNPNEEDYIEKLRIIWDKSIEKYKLTEDSVEIIEELEKLKLKIYDNPNNTYRIKSYIRYNNKKIEKQSEYKYAETEGIKIKKMIIDYSRKEISEKEKYGQVYFEYEYPNEVSEYKIYIKNEIGNYEEIGITAEKNYTYKSENLKPKEKYYYKIVPSDLTMDKVKEIEVEIPIEFPEMEVLKKEIKFTYAEVYITKPIELINSGYELKFNYLRTMATNGTIYSLSLTEEDEYCNLNNAYKFMSDKNMFQSGITFHNIEVYLMRYEKYDTENNITYRTYLRNDYLFKANN